MPRRLTGIDSAQLGPADVLHANGAGALGGALVAARGRRARLLVHAHGQVVLGLGEPDGLGALEAHVGARLLRGAGVTPGQGLALGAGDDPATLGALRAGLCRRWYGNVKGRKGMESWRLFKCPTL